MLRTPWRNGSRVAHASTLDWQRAKGSSKLTWDNAKHATRDSWQRVSDAVERAAPGDSDRDGK